MAKNVEKQAYPPIHALIVAAGNGTRMGNDVPKQFWNLDDHSVLWHAVKKFYDLGMITTLNVVINPAHKDLAEKALEGLDNVNFIDGGASRKQSVYNALKSITPQTKEDIVIIHDAARPMVSAHDIENTMKVAIIKGSATLSTPVTDTIFDGTTKLDRSTLKSVQTPQAFNYEIIHAAHLQFLADDGFTDDAGIVMAYGHPVDFVTATTPNIKITTAADFDSVKMMMNNNFSIRTASGFDVHAFVDDTERPLILGGIEIKSDRALKGHSDADVILHAITDAVLGCINEGDIGSHFPPSDDKWKDKDSSFFLEEAMKMLLAHNGRLEFIDVTVIGEKPKIGKYRKSIQTRIAEIMGVNKDIVSIKATTTEGLGFTGREEGLACQATATIKIEKT